MSSPLIGEICAKPDEDGKINKCGEKKKKKWRQGYWHAAVCLEERRNARETRQGSRKTWAGTSECDTDATLMTHLVQCDNQGGWGVKMAQRDQLVAVDACQRGQDLFFGFFLSWDKKCQHFSARFETSSRRLSLIDYVHGQTCVGSVNTKNGHGRVLLRSILSANDRSKKKNTKKMSGLLHFWYTNLLGSIFCTQEGQNAKRCPANMLDNSKC